MVGRVPYLVDQEDEEHLGQAPLDLENPESMEEECGHLAGGTYGSVKITFQLLQPSLDDTPPIFQFMMITPLAFEEDIPVHAFHSDGSVTYTDKINGHFIWDIDPNMCDDHCSCKRKKKPKASCSQSKQPFKPGDPDSPWIGLHTPRKPLDVYEEALRILKEEGLLPPELESSPETESIITPSSQSIPCYMASSYDYNADFLPLERFTDKDHNIATRAFVQHSEILPDGR
ncbi:hypothetical protein ACOSQ3_018531 [Xanthoceras sorbifolium]